MRKRVFLLLVLLFSSFALSVPNAEAAQVSIPAVADSYVDSSDPDMNRGDSPFLYAYNHVHEYLNVTYEVLYNTWLKFDLSEIPSMAAISSVVLRVHTSNMNMYADDEVGVFLCGDNSWSEFGITWGNAPLVPGRTPVQIVNVAASFRYYDFDLSSVLKGRGFVSLVLRTLEPTPQYGWAVFDSRDGGDGPTLIVEYVLTSGQFGPVFVVAIGIAIAVVLLNAWVLIFQVRRRRIRDRAVPKTIRFFRSFG